jgi:hypothetical protein
MRISLDAYELKLAGWRTRKIKMAEKEGFEPPDPCESTVFKTAAINRSTTSPNCPSGRAGGIISKFLKLWKRILRV